jgi:hypothetical protein
MVYYITPSLERALNDVRRGDLDEYGRWVQELISIHEYSGYLVTFMFYWITGKHKSMTSAMMKDVKRFYSILVTRVVRDPRKAPSTRLPLLIALPDKPVPKYVKKNTREDAKINDGLHVHAIVLIPPNSRLKLDLRKHVRQQSKIYMDPKYTDIRKIDVQKIKSRPDYTTEYALKLLKNDPEFSDDLLILPVSKQELPAKEAKADSDHIET